MYRQLKSELRLALQEKRNCSELASLLAKQLQDLSRLLEGGNEAFFTGSLVAAEELEKIIVSAREQPLPEELLDYVEELQSFSAVVRDRQLTEAQVKIAADKLLVHSELNKLLASGAKIERIMRNLCQTLAYQFRASCAAAFLLSDNEREIVLQGSFGIRPEVLPNRILLAGTQIERVIRLGGIMSILNLSTNEDTGLGWVSNQGFSTAHLASANLRGKALGLLMFATQECRSLDQFESDLFDEVAKSAAVAIIHAKNQVELERYATKLEQLVEQRTAALKIQTEIADEASRAKSQFVANISHELRTPLTAIVGYSSVITEGIFGEINQQQQEGLEAISKAAEHLKELINDILDSCKIEAGREEAQVADVDVKKICEQGMKLLFQSAINKSIKIELVCDGHEEEFIACMDPRHLRQILLNLISNAVKYTPDGGVVQIILEGFADKIKISVKDNGIGIASEDHNKLFERFSRVEDGYSRSQIGTGIGLSLSKRLVEINGGKIGFESEKGQGSVFWILIPRTKSSESLYDQKTEIQSQSNLLRQELKGLNVLVVDDNHLVCEVLQTIIRSAGGNPLVANSVQKAKDLLHAHYLDAALVDLAMPGESGIELIDYIRQATSKTLAAIPVIVISACVFDKDRRESERHGASLFIAKPFDPVVVVDSVRKLTTSAAFTQ